MEKAHGPRALVTAATGAVLLQRPRPGPAGPRTPTSIKDYIISVHRLLARVLSLPVVTVAALQGHASAAGAMLSLAHDLRVMRAY